MAKRMLVFVAAIMMLMNGIVAEDFTVGDDGGWATPSSSDFYSSWAAGKTFAVGDTLVFNFNTGSHTVAMVSRNGYDQCDAGNADVHTDGPTQITLNETGSHYFICTVDGHCDAGQKLAVNVTSATSPTATPPSTTPTTTPTPPSTTPTTIPSPPSTTPSPPSDDTGYSPSPPTPLTSTLFSVSFIAFVIALL